MLQIDLVGFITIEQKNPRLIFSRIIASKYQREKKKPLENVFNKENCVLKNLL